MPVIAVIAPGAMGSAVGKRLVENGAEVRTLLTGRSLASQARAQAAGMRGADLPGIAEAGIVLSIVPPGDAMGLARLLAPVLRPGAVYADCNAVSPQSVAGIGAVIAGAGVRFVDAGIIGGPPEPGQAGPMFYTSGPDAPALDVLARHGLRISDLQGEVGAASGLKMSYAGITKGLTGLAAAMILAATRSGAAPALARELAASQPELLRMFQRQVPGMYPKAYRWVAEMDEISAFVGEDAGARAIYEGMATLYAGIAADVAGAGEMTGALDGFLRRG